MTDKDERRQFENARERMVELDLMRRGISDEKLLEVFRKIPREDFVPNKYRPYAYSDSPLPIGCGQTISQPFIVALMTQSLHLKEDCEVLEIGTGCGYQTAILASLCRRVYTIERFGQLSEFAQASLAGNGIQNVEFYIGDGSKGWTDDREFDRIIFTAGAPDFPKPLIEQLKEDGIIVGPVGYEGYQKLYAAKKTTEGLKKQTICDVRFVRLVGDYGFHEEEGQ